MIAPVAEDGRTTSRPAARWLAEYGLEGQLDIQASRRYGTQSPLRYPGGKAVLAGVFADMIKDLGLKQAKYVEPYQGEAQSRLRRSVKGGVTRCIPRWPAVSSDNAAGQRGGA